MSVVELELINLVFTVTYLILVHMTGLGVAPVKLHVRGYAPWIFLQNRVNGLHPISFIVDITYPQQPSEIVLLPTFRDFITGTRLEIVLDFFRLRAQTYIFIDQLTNAI